MASGLKRFGGIEDFPPFGRREVAVADNSVTAAAESCPHGGAPLAASVRHGANVIFPRRKAAAAAWRSDDLPPRNAAPQKVLVRHAGRA